MRAPEKLKGATGTGTKGLRCSQRFGVSAGVSERVSESAPWGPSRGTLALKNWSHNASVSQCHFPLRAAGPVARLVLPLETPTVNTQDGLGHLRSSQDAFAAPQPPKNPPTNCPLRLSRSQQSLRQALSTLQQRECLANTFPPTYTCDCTLCGLLKSFCFSSCSLSMLDLCVVECQKDLYPTRLKSTL